MMSRRATLTWMVLALLCIGAGGLRLCVGQKFGWPSGDLLGAVRGLFVWPIGAGGGARYRVGVLDIRLLRLVLAVLVGVALSTSGVALQVLLRNPLAEPFILGLSSGAAVGVMAQSLLSYHLQRVLAAQHVGAMIGAVVSMMAVYAASRRRGVIDPLGLLLIGVVLGTINGAIILFLNYVSGSAGLRADISRWMMGYLNEAVGQVSLTVVVGVTVLGFVALLTMSSAMDVATFSDSEAASMGVNLPRLRLVLFVVASSMAAGAVVLSGPISFVGLICPHIGRLLLGPRHQPLLLSSAMIGIILVVVADMASVTMDLGQGQLPLGIFTAVFGGGCFIWMLRPQLGRETQ